MNWSVRITPHALSLSSLLAPPSSDIEQPLAAILSQYLLKMLVKWSDGYQQRALVVLRRLSPLEAREALMKAQAKVGSLTCSNQRPGCLENKTSSPLGRRPGARTLPGTQALRTPVYAAALGKPQIAALWNKGLK